MSPPARGRRKAKERAWKREEARRFLAAADADRLFAVWRLALALGCRPGELVGLRWSEVDFEAGTVSIIRQVQPKKGGGVLIREETKTDDGRTNPIDGRTLTALRRWHTQQLEERIAFGPAYADEGWVVAEPDGQVIKPRTVATHWNRVIKTAGVRRIVPYGARHTSATLAFEAGERAEVVAERLGNSVGILLSTYAHVTPRAQREAADRLATVLDGE